MTRPSIQICLLGHSSNSDNLGVGALTASQIAILRDAARQADLDLNIVIMDWKDPRAPYVGGEDIEIIKCSGKDLLNPFKYFRQLRRADIVIDIGGGDSFADIYGFSRLFKMSLARYQALLAGRPLILAPQTYGPFKRFWSRALSRPLFRYAAGVFARDDLSIDYLKSIGFKGDIVQASDVALALPFDRPQAAGDTGAVKVGLNVSGLLMNGGYSRANMFGLKGDYPALINTIVEDFMARDNCRLTLVPHVISDTHAIEDDYRASEALADAYPGLDIAPKFETPSDAKSYISGLDFFMGARMHSCIAAFSSGVPVVPMAYSRKFAGLFGALGYHRTVDCVADDNAAVHQAIADAFEARDAVKTEVETALSEGRNRLYQYTDALSVIVQTLRAGLSSGRKVTNQPAASP